MGLNDCFFITPLCYVMLNSNAIYQMRLSFQLCNSASLSVKANLTSFIIISTAYYVCSIIIIIIIQNATLYNRIFRNLLCGPLIHMSTSPYPRIGIGFVPVQMTSPSMAHTHHRASHANRQLAPVYQQVCCTYPKSTHSLGGD